MLCQELQKVKMRTPIMDNDVFSSDTIYLGMKMKEDNK
jgi:hypothetical protein